ncbi:MAG: carbohydrate kinase family protein [Desulfuromonadaceae bacterium]|nr:carbohydrate kinase family protein [Desulfuromonadaceae bacterium]
MVGPGQCSLDILGSLDQYPPPPLDSKCHFNGALIQGGGPPVATALVTLARLGVVSAFVGRIGGDDFGRRIGRGLQDEGVDCRHLLVDEVADSQFAFIAVEQARGLRTIFCHRGNCRPLSVKDLPIELIRSRHLLHLDGSPLDAALVAARQAKEVGVIPRPCVCGVNSYASVQALDFLDLGKNCSFPI